MYECVLLSPFIRVDKIKIWFMVNIFRNIWISCHILTQAENVSLIPYAFSLQHAFVYFICSHFILRKYPFHFRENKSSAQRGLVLYPVTHDQQGADGARFPDFHCSGPLCLRGRNGITSCLKTLGSQTLCGTYFMHN